MKKLLWMLFILFLLQRHSFSQNQQVLDSLLSQLNSGKQDTSEVNTLNALARQFSNNDPDTSVYFCNKALELAAKLNYTMGVADAYLRKGTAIMVMGKNDEALKNCSDALKIYDQLLNSSKSAEKTQILKGKAAAYNSIGLIYAYMGNYAEALKNHSASLKISEEIRDKKNIANSSNSIGIVYLYLSNYTEALKMFFVALKIQEEIDHKVGIANTCFSIANIYSYQGNFDEALKMYFTALKIQKINGDKIGISNSLGSIGTVYCDQGNYPKAMTTVLAALKIQEEIGDKHSTAHSYNNIGYYYLKLGDYTEALKNLFTSLKIYEETGNKYGIVGSCNNIGNVYIKQKNNSEASQFLNRSLSLAKELGYIESIADNYSSLATLDSARESFKEALEYYKLFVTYRDSTANSENTNKLLGLQLQYDTEKKEKQITLLTKESQLQQTELQKQNTTRNVLIAAFALTALLAGTIYNRYRIKKKANLEIEKTMQHLKNTQEQLIEREKLASLGKLTADVAREVEVPVTSINRLNLLNRGLMNSIKSNIIYENKCAEELQINLKQIHEHGKVADRIVKNVLTETRKLQ